MADTEKLDKAKYQALERAIKEIEKKFGKGSIMVLEEKTPITNVEVIPTGSIALDVALGVGGYPRGRVVEIYGAEGSGKTTLCLHAIAEAQKLGGVAAFVDAEHALDPVYAKAIGVDLHNLLISQPDFGEQALEVVDELVRSNAVDLVIVDSVAALVPRAEIEGVMGDMQVGLQARLMSQALRKLASSVSKSKAVVIFTNQLRMKIGVTYGNPETTTGGMALKFYASVRLDVRRGASIMLGKEIIGHEVNLKVVKNKVAPPFKKVTVDIIFGKGIVRENELFNLGLEMGIIKRKGSWFSYEAPDGEEISLGQGKLNAVEYLQQHPELADQLEELVRAQALPSTTREKNVDSTKTEKS
ncbi:MAG: recombinase RecA [Thermotogae bacterium]|nr:recombinase RecA [Thermotogota bacterium]